MQNFMIYIPFLHTFATPFLAQEHSSLLRRTRQNTTRSHQEMSLSLKTIDVLFLFFTGLVSQVKTGTITCNKMSDCCIPAGRDKKDPTSTCRTRNG